MVSIVYGVEFNRLPIEVRERNFNDYEYRYGEHLYSTFFSNDRTVFGVHVLTVNTEDPNGIDPNLLVNILTSMPEAVEFHDALEYLLNVNINAYPNFYFLSWGD